MKLLLWQKQVLESTAALSRPNKAPKEGVFRQHFPPTPAGFVHFGHQVPFVLLPINRITAITSAGQHGPLGAALGTEAGAAAKQFCLEGKGEKKRERPNSYK